MYSIANLAKVLTVLGEALKSAGERLKDLDVETGAEGVGGYRRDASQRPAGEEQSAVGTLPGQRKMTAREQVLNVIGSNPEGVSTRDIGRETGFNSKKVANIIYRLQKDDLIDKKDRGVYVKK